MSTSTEREELLKQARKAYKQEYRAKMTDEQKEHERQYMRAWRKNNPEKVKRHQENFLLRRFEELKKSE